MGSIHSDYIQELENAQKKVDRLVYNSYSPTSITNLLRLQTYDYSTTTAMHKLLQIVFLFFLGQSRNKFT